MQFYIIYQFDCPNSESVETFKPSKSWQLTECSFENGDKHRKYIKIVSQAELDAFVQEQNLYCEGVKTLGSLTELGWLPAISFNGISSLVHQSAYVSPLPAENLGQAELFSPEETLFDISRIEKRFWIEYGTEPVYENPYGIQ